MYVLERACDSGRFSESPSTWATVEMNRLCASQSERSPHMSAARFAFTKVFVNDLDTEAAFYLSTFDMTEKARLSFGAGSDALEEVILKTEHGDDSSFILWRYLERQTPSPGEATLGFAVADIHDTILRVKANGGSVVQDANKMPEAGVAVAFVADPEGHLLEIVQNL